MFIRIKFQYFLLKDVRIGNFDSTILFESWEVLVDICSSEDVILLCEDLVQHFREFATGLINKEYKTMRTNAQLR
jgi:hypothetical protein